MNIPKTVKIGFKDYNVLFPHDFKDSDDPTMGMCDYQRQELKISATDGGKPLKDQTVIHTLMHEVLHAIEVGCEHRVFRDKNGKTLESALDAWAEWLCMVLRDNPELVGLFVDKIVDPSFNIPGYAWDFFAWVKGEYEPTGSGSRYEKRLIAIRELLTKMDAMDSDANLHL